MLRARTAGVEATRALAARIASLVAAGDVILLAGDLGAGKTAFAQGFAAGLGVEDQVTSPTFTLARHYEGRLPLHHVDVYRLDRLSEVEDVGIPELLDSGGVLLVEWGDVIAPTLPAEYLEIRFGYGDADDDRELQLRCVGGRWTERAERLASSIAAWGVAG
jgi:tRNA threonylcarbamoyladenosine biosynthesis protein TsaE